MGIPLDIISESFHKLKQSLSDEDAHNFDSTELKDVWKAVREIDSAQRQRQSAQNLRRIEPLLKGIEKYAKVIEILCNGTPFMPYVWAPIKLMIQLASQHYNVFELLLTAYAEIGAALPRFDRYDKTFSGNLEFQNVLAAVYSGILDFHRRAYVFFRRRAWYILFSSLWKDFESRFAVIIDGLRKQRDFVDREAISIDIAESKESRSRLQEEISQRHKYSLHLIEQNEVSASIARLQHSIAWLSVSDGVQEAHYDRISRRRHDETCEWIMRQSEMQFWTGDGTKYPILWLSGKPGAGKTVMSSYIIQELLKTPKINTCYYFCNSQDPENVCAQILRTFALQFLRSNNDLASLICNQFVYQGMNCGLKELKVLITQLLELSSCTRIIIDGIDECSKENQVSVLKHMQTLFFDATSHCKILISSRKEAHIAEKLSKKPQICLDDRLEVDSDIKLFVRSNVGSLRTSDTVLSNKIETILIDKANGMFLWVRLVIDELRSCYSDWDLEETANSLPRGLKAAYGRILDRIMDEQSSAAYAIRILQWMACCYRPLKIYEILDGISLRPGCTVLSYKTRMRREVLDLCRPLIEDGPFDTLGFVHFSAKEYILEEEFRQRGPFISNNDAHLSICFSCVAYLNTSYPLLPDRSTELERAAIVVHGFHGLHLYANQFWVDHLLECCASLRKQKKQLPNYLLEQIIKLFGFQKDLDTKPFDLIQVPSIEIFQQPQLVTLVKSIIWLRDKTKQGNSPNVQEMSIEGASLERCALDPTHFSAARQSYQTSVELLLAPRVSQVLPGIDPRTLQAFAETFGPSAFVCRHFNCVRATQGFNSSKLRATHEATHERRFRCTDPSCVNFSTGFATRSDLNRHNDKYHATVDSYTSLSETITNVIKLPLRAKAQGSHLTDDPYINYAGDPSPSRLDNRQRPRMVIHDPSEEATWSQKSLESQTTSSEKPTLESYDNGNPTRESHITHLDNFTLQKIGLITQQEVDRRTLELESAPSSNASIGRNTPNQNGPAAIQIQSIIFNTLNTQTGPLFGWKARVVIQERIGLILNIIGKLRLASQHQPNPPPLSRMINIGIRFEKDIFEKSTSKDDYEWKIQLKLYQLLERLNRNQTIPTVLESTGRQAEAEAQPQKEQFEVTNQDLAFQGSETLLPQDFSHRIHQIQTSTIPVQQPQKEVSGTLPDVPAGWKAQWNDQYEEWFYVNIYTRKSQWEKPTEPIYLPKNDAPLGPPPGLDTTRTDTGITRCVCNNPESERSMIQCESCDNWLHAECVGIDVRSLPPVYICAFCTQMPDMRGGRIQESTRGNGHVGSSPLAHKSFKSLVDQREQEPQQHSPREQQTHQKAAGQQLAVRMFTTQMSNNIKSGRVVSEEHRNRLWSECQQRAVQQIRANLQPQNKIESRGPPDDSESKFLDSFFNGTSSDNFDYNSFNNAHDGDEPGLRWNEPTPAFIETTSSFVQQPRSVLVPQQLAQQEFSHLQNQILPSPLTDQQLHQAPLAIQGTTEDMPQIQQQIPPPQNIPGRQAITQTNLSPEDNAFVNELTSRLILQASDEQNNALKASVEAQFDPEQLRKIISQGRDPLFMYYRNQALNQLRTEKQKRIAQAEQLTMWQQPQLESQNIPVSAPLSKHNATNAIACSAASGIAQLRKSSEYLPATLDDFIFSDNISTPAGLGMSPSPELRKESEKSYGASAIPTKIRKETPQFAVPQSVPISHEPMQQKGSEPKPLEWPTPGLTLPSGSSMQYQPDLATLQPSSYPRHAAAPEPRSFTFYSLYHESGMHKLGIKKGEYFYCRYARHHVLRGLCNELCIGVEQLQKHIENQHSSFIRMKEPYRAICSYCESLNRDDSGDCETCGTYGSIQVWVCGKRIRAQAPLDDVVDAHKRRVTIAPGNSDQSESSATEHKQQQTHELPLFEPKHMRDLPDYFSMEQKSAWKN